MTLGHGVARPQAGQFGDLATRGSRIAGLVAATLTLGGAAAVGQGPPPATRASRAPVFAPLVADPQEPKFFASYLFASSPELSSRLAMVGFGQTIGLVRGPNWQLSIAPATVSQFDMQTPTTDLMNTDYLVGVPFAYRRGRWSARFRIYHFSSHLGDGYILHGFARPFKLGFEAVELLAAEGSAPWRFYGGGEYMLHHIPARLEPGALHAGIEYHGGRALVRLGRFGTGRLVAGLDAKSYRDRQWQVGCSVVAGLDLEAPDATPGTGWHWSLVVTAYTGPPPYGQFYQDYLSYVGAGLRFAL
jgi:Protein of unknown function (DUF1207)